MISNAMNESNDPAERTNAERARFADELAAEQPLLRCSICLKCSSHRTIVSGKGSVFMLCQSDETPSDWPKYPAQPMQQCRYYRSE